MLAGGEATDENRSFRLVLREPCCGCGAANWVDEVIVDVEGRGATAGTEGCEAGCAVAADWKSSKSSSSAPGSAAMVAACFALELALGAGSSSKESRSTAGSLGLGGSAFFTSRRTWLDAGSICSLRRGGAATSPSSYSSYSSKRSRRLCASENPE